MLKGSIFVTGLHRAGTHFCADSQARINRLAMVEEREIKHNSLALARSFALNDQGVPRGIVIQCPGLAHETVVLAKWGTVFWCVRGRADLIASMRTKHMGRLSVQIIESFREKFPDDPIWATVVIPSQPWSDRQKLMLYQYVIDIATHCYQTYFKRLVRCIKLENQPGYCRETTGAFMSPLSPSDQEGLR